MKHRDLVEMCAIIASRLPPEQFYAQNASDIVGYRLEAERVLRAVFEAVKKPDEEMTLWGLGAARDDIEPTRDEVNDMFIAMICASALNPEN